MVSITYPLSSLARDLRRLSRAGSSLRTFCSYYCCVQQEAWLRGWNKFICYGEASLKTQKEQTNDRQGSDTLTRSLAAHARGGMVNAGGLHKQLKANLTGECVSEMNIKIWRNLLARRERLLSTVTEEVSCLFVYSSCTQHNTSDRVLDMAKEGQKNARISRHRHCSQEKKRKLKREREKEPSRFKISGSVFVMTIPGFLTDRGRSSQGIQVPLPFLLKREQRDLWGQKFTRGIPLHIAGQTLVWRNRRRMAFRLTKWHSPSPFCPPQRLYRSIQFCPNRGICITGQNFAENCWL